MTRRSLPGELAGGRRVARDEGFVDWCVELLAPLGAVRARRMFGGHGLYVDELFVAIIADEVLYLKADAETAPGFAAAGSEAFAFEAKGRRMTMSFWRAPEAAMDAPAGMLPWGRLAVEAALRARQATRPRGPRPAPARPPGARKPRLKGTPGRPKFP